MGIVLPNEIVEKKGLKPSQEIFIDIVTPTDLSKVFGTLKTKKTGQQFKDEVRKGWN